MTEASIRTYQEMQEDGTLDGARDKVYMAFRDGDQQEGTAGGISGVLKTQGIEMSSNNVSSRIGELVTMCLLVDSGEKCRMVKSGKWQTIYYVRDSGHKYIPPKKKIKNITQFCPHCGKLIGC